LPTVTRKFLENSEKYADKDFQQFNPARYNGVSVAIYPTLSFKEASYIVIVYGKKRRLSYLTTATQFSIRQAQPAGVRAVFLPTTTVQPE
jgi:hypothetical protein